MEVIVGNIQRFCLNDGPGIRTTVFLKGCNLKCPWCANPENIDYDIKNINSTIYGYKLSLEELENEILKDKDYYSTGGGVTFSGGEPLLQFKNIEPLLKKLKSSNISIAVETALMVDESFIKIALKYVDYFYVDVKIIDKDVCKSILNGDILLYKRNLKLLKNANVIYRIPLVKKYTYTEDNIKLIKQLLIDNNINKVEIFRIHNLADQKYRKLNKNVPIFEKITDKEINEFANYIKDVNIGVEIIKF